MLNNYLNIKQAESDKVTSVHVHEKYRSDCNNRKKISSLKPGSELKNVWNRKIYWQFQLVTALFPMCKDKCTGSETPETKWLSLLVRLHETRSELKPVWNVKQFWKVVLFAWRFYCVDDFLINGNLIDMKQMLRYWLYF